LTVAKLRELVERGSRAPFHDAISRAFAGGPSKSDWRKLARKSPHLWAAGVDRLAEPAGYVPRSATVGLQIEVTEVAAELVSRYGADRARTMLEAAGLPAGLLGEGPPEAEAQVEAEAGAGAGGPPPESDAFADSPSFIQPPTLAVKKSRPRTKK